MVCGLCVLLLLLWRVCWFPGCEGSGFRFSFAFRYSLVYMLLDFCVVMVLVWYFVCLGGNVTLLGLSWFGFGVVWCFRAVM